MKYGRRRVNQKAAINLAKIGCIIKLNGSSLTIPKFLRFDLTIVTSLKKKNQYSMIILYSPGNNSFDGRFAILQNDFDPKLCY